MFPSCDIAKNSIVAALLKTARSLRSLELPRGPSKLAVVSPNFAALPVVDIVTNSISVLTGEFPTYTALSLTPLLVAPTKCLGSTVSPKSLALPVVEIVTNSIVFFCPWPLPPINKALSLGPLEVPPTPWRNSNIFPKSMASDGVLIVLNSITSVIAKPPKVIPLSFTPFDAAP